METLLDWNLKILENEVEMFLGGHPKTTFHTTNVVISLEVNQAIN